VIIKDSATPQTLRETASQTVNTSIQKLT